MLSRDAGALRAPRRRRPHCDVSTGRLHRLSTPPRLAARLKTCRRSKKRAARVVAAADVDAHHAAEAAHLALRRSRGRGAMPGPGSTPRVDARVRLEPARNRHRVRVVALDAQRRSSSRRARARTPPPDRGRVAEHLRAPSRSARSARAGPASAPAVTSVWPLRYFVDAVHHEIDAERDRLLIDRAGERVVDDRDARRARGTRAATAAISTQRSVGLIGDSNQTTLRRRREQRSRDAPARRATRSAP